MKQILVLAIAFMVIGLITVSAQSPFDDPEIAQLVSDFTSGRITEQEYQRRMMILMQGSQGMQLRDYAGDTATPEQQRQRVDQERMMQDFQQFQQQGGFGYSPNGWPTTQTMARYGNRITRPAGDFGNMSHTVNEDEVTINIVKTNNQDFTSAEVRALYNHFKEMGTWSQVNSEDFTRRVDAFFQYQDPQRRNQGMIAYWIRISVSWYGGNVFEVIIKPVELINAG